MKTAMDIPDKEGRKRLVIVGGGFGGLKLARKLKSDKYQIVLLDKNNHHIFQPLLYQVATAGIEPSAISFPYRKIFKKREHFHFIFVDWMWSYFTYDPSLRIIIKPLKRE